MISKGKGLNYAKSHTNKLRHFGIKKFSQMQANSKLFAQNF